MEVLGAALAAIGALMLVAGFYAPKFVQRWILRGKHMDEQGAAEKRVIIWTGGGVVVAAAGALLLAFVALGV